MASTDTKITLIHSEDWEQWFNELQAHVSDELWPYIRPDGEVRDLREEPPQPKTTDFEPNARTYATLSAQNQKAYDNARRYYDQDMRYYSRQRDQIKKARAYIMLTVSASKKIMLKPEKSVREWIQQLKQDTEPAKGYMILQTKRRYHNTLRSFKTNKLSQWLDEWEAIMVEAIEHDLPEIMNESWLRDLAQLMRQVSDAFSLQLIKEASDDIKSDPREFQRVARELRELLEIFPKSGHTMRGNAFHASLGLEGSSESEASHTKKADKAQKSKGKGRKRAATKLNKNSIFKKPAVQCPACEIKGYSLEEYWLIFEELRPEGLRLPCKRLQKAEQKMKDNKQLAAQMQEIYEKMFKTLRFK